MDKTLGKYELIEEVGRGAMGKVYKAYDPLIGRHVALKTITNSLVGNAELLERFYREARAAGTLQHPNIVTVYELVREGGTPFIAMEFLEGEALEKIISRRADLSVAEKVGLIVPVCRALEYAHKRGFVHRDIKPGNVMVTKDGNVKVVDFGIARFEDSSSTETNLLIGTLGYMSPQQIRGEKADERADIWALGVTFYELLCHRRPFEAQSQATLMLNIIDVQKPPAPMADLLPECPPAVEAIVMKLLQKDIEKRFQTMEEVLIEIEPVWKRLQEESVAGLIGDAERLMGTQDFSQARDLLRKCLGIDGRNERAKALLEQINEEMKHNRVLFQVKAVLARAQELLNKKRFPEAEAEAEAAIKIDPASTQARELLAEVKQQAEKKRLAQQGLQTAKKRVAEGELTRAAMEVEKVLQMEADNTQARALQLQIQDLAGRREERRQAQEALQQGRKLWAELRFDECIALLTAARQRFAGEPEIEKLLETVTQDQAEQDKQQKLIQVRGLLAEQRAADARDIIETLLAVHPHDQTVQTAHRLVLQECANLSQRERFQNETAELRKLMEEGKFSEAASRGELLLREFPQEAELTELVSYAREEAAQSQRRRSLEEALGEVREKVSAGQYREAVIAAEIALARFPHDPALKAVRQEALAQQHAKEKRDLFQRRIEEIRGSINRGQYTDAVDLARQTLSTLGANDEVTRLLASGEVELAEKRKQQKREAGELTEATHGFDPLRGTQVLARKVWDGLERLRRRGLKPASGGAPEDTWQPGQAADASQETPANASSAQDYVFLQGAGPTQTAFPSGGAQAQPSPSPAAMSSGRPNPEIAEEVLEITALPSQQWAEIAARVARACVETCRRVGLRVWRNAVATAKDEPVLCGLLVFSVVLGLATCLFRPAGMSKIQAKLHVVDNKDEIDLFNRAEQLEQQKQWPQAQAAYETLARRQGALAGEGRAGSDRLRQLLYQENSLLGRSKAELSVENFSAAKGLSQQVAALHGDKEQEANDTLRGIVAAEAAAAGRKRKPPKEPAVAGTIGAQPAAKKEPPPTETRNCELLPNNIPIYLDRADSDRARGDYTDAERLYGDVLACDSKNERASTGLEKSRQAKALPARNN